MIRFKSTTKAYQAGKIPVWKNHRHPRFAGFFDSLFHKTQRDKYNSEAQELIHSGEFIILQCEFDEYLSAWRMCLNYEIDRLQKRACDLIPYALERRPESRQSVGKKTSGALRAEKEEAKRRAKKAEEAAAAIAELRTIRESIFSLCKMADAKVAQSQKQADQYIAKYCKATGFRVIEKEIPQIKCSFSANTIPDKEVMATINNIIGIRGDEA